MGGDATRRSHRATVAGLLIFAGLVLAGNGLALWVASPLAPRGALSLVGAGVVLLLLAAGLMRREWVRGFTSPSFPALGRVIVAGLLGVGVFGVLSSVNARHFWRVHLAETGRGGLTARTRNVLGRLDGPLRVVAALPEQESPLEQLSNRVRQRARELLEEYAKQSRHVSVVSLDPGAEPELAERLEEELAVRGDIRPDTVVFSYAGRARVVELRQFLAPPKARGEQPQFRGEAVLTAVVQALIEGEPTRVYFVTGHGEKLIEDFDEAGPGLSKIGGLLRQDNCTVQTTELPEIPDDCDVLVIPGPRTLLPLHEIQAVREYARREDAGLIILLDPVTPDEPRGSGLEDILLDYGIVADTERTVLTVTRGLLGKTRVSAQVATAQYPPAAAGQGGAPQWHPITDELRQFRVVFDGACPVSGGDGSRRREKGPFTVELVRTSRRAFARRGLHPEQVEGIQPPPEAQRGGPFGLAAARGPWPGASGDRPSERVVVFGDSDFVTNAYVRAGGSANAALFRNAVAWAAGQGYKTGIPPQPFGKRRELDLTPRQRAWAFWATVFTPPFHAVLIGFLVWWLRRR